MSKEFHFPKIEFSRLFPHVIVLFLVVSAALVLAWVSWLTWIDVTEWGKDLGSIFFGSRVNEPISLGIGMTVMHYLLIGLSLLATGVVLFLRNRILAMKPQHAMQMEVQKTSVKNSEEDTSEVEPLVNEENAAVEEEKRFLGCPHYFGYLSSRPEASAIPQECMLCQRLGQCMVAAVYVKKFGK
ncbi:MAG: hypothetical protein PVH73_10100 [Candidatus Bathyarchaeota archaeon]|jgi:hypothetical protein